MKKLCKLSIHFDTPFQKVIEEHAAYDKMAKQNPKNGSAYTMEQRQRKAREDDPGQDLNTLQWLQAESSLSDAFSS